jgi:hypothetical protein
MAPMTPATAVEMPSEEEEDELEAADDDELPEEEEVDDAHTPVELPQA